ncbi:tripartite tricarboxylate transporter substrate-binding protein [Dankookia sp. P2]|uniref:tripartite tricarboxylate transporter substrate-binding protein n=1 Tax=Dankookia sp. P2 TaxID=3423955 RepID=UPI003D67FDDF
MLARLVTQRLGDRLDPSLVIENRPGGSGVVGSQVLLGAPADGHLLILATGNTHTVLPAANPKLPFDPTAVVPVTGIAAAVMALVARPWHRRSRTRPREGAGGAALARLRVLWRRHGLPCRRGGYPFRRRDRADP